MHPMPHACWASLTPAEMGEDSSACVVLPCQWRESMVFSSFFWRCHQNQVIWMRLTTILCWVLWGTPLGTTWCHGSGSVRFQICFHILRLLAVLPSHTNSTTLGAIRITWQLVKVGPTLSPAQLSAQLSLLQNRYCDFML